MDEKQNPLWMPEGSVRALLALGVVGVVLGALVFAPSVKDIVVTALVGFANLVLGFYFGSRKK